WGGGIYNWFDPLTLLRAVDKLRRRLPEVRLYFLGLKHPNPQVGEMKMADDAVALADELGLVGTHVFFNEDWVEYDDRQNYLLEEAAFNRSCRDAIERVGPTYRWSMVLQPLLEFCRTPSRAPDLVDPETAAMVGSLGTGMWDRIGWRADLRKTLRFARRREWR